MEMKIKDALSIYNNIKFIIDDKNTDITPLFKFKLLGIMKGLEATIINFEIVRNDIANKYGEKDDDGNITIKDDDLKETFKAEIDKVLNSVVEINLNYLKADEAFTSGMPAEYLLRLYEVISE